MPENQKLISTSLAGAAALGLLVVIVYLSVGLARRPAVAETEIPILETSATTQPTTMPAPDPTAGAIGALPPPPQRPQREVTPPQREAQPTSRPGRREPFRPRGRRGF